ncbi:hypothetical protein OROGR_017612 [Orobanche gracilis]
MAARKNHRYLGGSDHLNTEDLGDRFDFEFDEFEVWDTNDNITRGSEPKKPFLSPRPIRKPVRKGVNADHHPVGPRSLPVNIPDWSKILGGEYKPRAVEWTDDYADDDGNGWDDGSDRVPPHEYLARTRVASLSVHEGIGRTLKGRDLSRVRNAIWKKTGFED